MNLNRLEYFVAVAEELHFGRAAARLDMAQPPLSQQIRLLERELGLTLFERSTRKVSLTPAGRQLYPEALSVVARSSVLARSAQDLRTGAAGVLRIGFVDSASYEVLPRFIRVHRARWPRVTYELRSMSSDEQAAALERGSIDIGIARTMPDGDLEASTIVDEPLVVALNEDDPRRHQKATSLAALRHDRLIGFDRTVSPTLYAELARLFGESGGVYEPAIEATEYTTVLGLVAAGEGIAVVPSSVQSFRPADLGFVPLRESRARTALLFLRRAGERSELVNRALRIVDDVFPARRSSTSTTATSTTVTSTSATSTGGSR